jgi:predicted dienelactone hydrolase
MKQLAMGLMVLITWSSFAAQQLYTQQPSVTPELAESGEWSVGVRTIQVSNPQQLSADFKSLADRSLTLEVWYPAKVEENAVATSYENVTRLHKPFSVQGSAFRDAHTVSFGTFPLIVLSHGYTGYRTIMYYLGEHLASHGYVVVGIDHTDSTNAEIDFKNTPSVGFPSTLLNRARDQQFVLDYFSSQQSDLSAIIDSDKAAVIGYSMGGYGAINTVGGCYNFTSERLLQLGFPADMAAALPSLLNSCNAGRKDVDPRWKAMMAFSPWGQELNIHDGSAMASIKVPSFYVVGDQDDVSGYALGVKKLFEQTGTADKYMLVYENARHNVAPHPAPLVAYDSDEDLGHYFEPSWNSETLNRINKHMALAFLDCYVKGLTQSCDYLPQRQGSTQVKGAEGKLSAPWPGFKHRWGTGMKFYRGNHAN